MLKLSYAIPCYNHESYIQDALNAIKFDIKTHLLTSEILIIDDGSTDSSVQIINQWIICNPELNVRLIIQENQGIVRTVNKLYSLVEGEVVRLCASDDTIHAGSSIAMIDLMERKDSTLCVFGDGDVIDAQGLIIDRSFIEYHGGNPELLAKTSNLPGALLERWCIAGPCILVKKNVFEVYQYDEKSKIDDFDFFLYLFSIPNSISFLNLKVCSYRIHGTNTSKVKDINTRLKNLSSFLYLIEKHHAKPEMKYLHLSLKAQSYKVKCKILYLQKKYADAVLNYILYFICK